MPEYPLMRQVDGALLVAMEGYAQMAIHGKDWMMKLNEELLDNLGKYRRYNKGTATNLPPWQLW